MAYLTYAKYKTINPTSTLTDDGEFTFLAERASDIINDICKNRINYFGFSNFNTATQTAIEKATAAEIDILDSEGGADAINGGSSSGFGSLTIGRYSEGRSGASNASNSTYEMINGIPVAPMIRMYLRPTNLMYKGVKTYQIDDFNI